MKCIYKLWFKDNPKRVYVGSAVVFKKRKYKHKWDLKNNCHGNKYLQSVYNKHNYTSEDLKFELLEEIKNNEILIKQETYWCNYLKESGYELFNFNDPEVPPMLGKNHTEEAKQKQRKANLGKNNPNFGKHPSEETKQKMSENNVCYWKDKLLSEEHKQKLRENHADFSGENHPMYGKNHTKESNLKRAISSGAKPFQVFKNGKLVGEWINQTQCARELNLNQGQINGCLHKKPRYKTHKGYTFKFK